MKTLSEFRRKIKVGTKFVLVGNSYMKPENGWNHEMYFPGVVEIARADSFAIKGEGGPAWFFYPKAGPYRFDAQSGTAHFAGLSFQVLPDGTDFDPARTERYFKNKKNYDRAMIEKARQARAEQKNKEEVRRRAAANFRKAEWERFRASAQKVPRHPGAPEEFYLVAETEFLQAQSNGSRKKADWLVSTHGNSLFLTYQARDAHGKSMTRCYGESTLESALTKADPNLSGFMADPQANRGTDCDRVCHIHRDPIRVDGSEEHRIRQSAMARRPSLMYREKAECKFIGESEHGFKFMILTDQEEIFEGRVPTLVLCGGNKLFVGNFLKKEIHNSPCGLLLDDEHSSAAYIVLRDAYVGRGKSLPIGTKIPLLDLVRKKSEQSKGKENSLTLRETGTPMVSITPAARKRSH